MAETVAKERRGFTREAGSGAGGRRRVTFVTDIPTPYMLEVLDALAGIVDLTVLFCAQTGSRAMPWSLGGSHRFRHQLIDGLAIRSGAPDRPDYYLSPRILTALGRSRPDAVISAGYSIPTAYAAVYGRLRGSPLIIYSDGTSHYERNLGRHQLLARAVLLRAASACVAKSRPAAERFMELGVAADRVFLAPHSSTMDPLWRIARERDYERPGKLTVLTAGRLVPHKGVDRLLIAAARAEGGQARIRLVIAGSGPESERLRRLADELGLEDVQFRGFVDHADMPELYAEADAFAFPTFDDPFGIVLLEAAAAGLPLIASRHAGAAWDLIGDAESGVIVDPADVDGFAAALGSLAGDAPRRRRLGQAAHRATLDRSPLDSARGYASAIETGLGDRRGAMA
jgi:glycosyltransferase involved in cell wall biosynthesis